VALDYRWHALAGYDASADNGAPRRGVDTGQHIDDPRHTAVNKSEIWLGAEIDAVGGQAQRPARVHRRVEFDAVDRRSEAAPGGGAQHEALRDPARQFAAEQRDGVVRRRRTGIELNPRGLHGHGLRAAP